MGVLYANVLYHVCRALVYYWQRVLVDWHALSSTSVDAKQRVSCQAIFWKVPMKVCREKKGVG